MTLTPTQRRVLVDLCDIPAGSGLPLTPAVAASVRAMEARGLVTTFAVASGRGVMATAAGRAMLSRKADRPAVVGDRVYIELTGEFGTVYSVEDDGTLVVEMVLGRNFTPHTFEELAAADCMLV